MKEKKNEGRGKVDNTENVLIEISIYKLNFNLQCHNCDPARGSTVQTNTTCLSKCLLCLQTASARSVLTIGRGAPMITEEKMRFGTEDVCASRKMRKTELGGVHGTGSRCRERHAILRVQTKSPCCGRVRVYRSGLGQVMVWRTR